MICPYCGDTGITKNGTHCTNCNGPKPYLEGNTQMKFVNQRYKESNFLESFNPQLYKDLQEFDYHKNYIIQYAQDQTGTNEETAVIFATNLQRNMLASKRSILPIMTGFHFKAIINMLNYQKQRFLYAENIEIEIEDIVKADLMIFKLSAQLTEYESSNLARLLDYRNNANKGLVILTDKGNFIKGIKTFPTIIRTIE